MEKKNWFERSQEIRKRALAMSWSTFQLMEEKDKTVFLNDPKTGNPFHVLFSQQFDRRGLDLLCQVAERARIIHKNRTRGRRFLKDLLSGTYALNFFHQPSTRTFLSFQTAQETLGMGIRDIRDPSTSSEAKGETLEDSIRTFSSYVDLMVMRHPGEQAAELGAWVLNKSDRRIPIINAGSGKDQHPTQALTDVYTLYKSFDGKIDNRTIVMVGDLARGRTVRSLSYLMRNYQGVKLIFVSPPRLRVGNDIKSFLVRHHILYQEADNLEEVIPYADAIYMTRVQDEWDEKDQGEPIPGQVKIHQPVDEKYKFKREYLDLMKEHAVLMHPLPKRDEIDEDISYLSDKRVVFWRQERNGMWIRVALIAAIFQKENEILNCKSWLLG
ncbi:MAG: aspartate carbamoyltransferase [Parcubacteria group bacterium]|nr:aspartate carbamoyltransferase [Parcubacteria group bacterium]